MKMNNEEKRDDNLTPFYKIYVYGEDNDRVEEIYVNPIKTNTLINLLFFNLKFNIVYDNLINYI